MRSVSEIVPVTIVQEVFTPSDEVKTLVGRLMEGEPDLSNLVLRSSARRVVPRPPAEVHPRYRHASEFHQADKTLDGLGRRALMLGNNAFLAEHPSGRSRLMIPPRNQEELDLMVGAMDILPSIEDDPSTNFLYIQFAKDSLTQDVQKRAQGVARFGSLLRHQGYRPYMRVTNPRIVTQDASVRSS